MKTVDCFRAALKLRLDSRPDITQTALAEKIGVSKSQVNDFIKGRINFSEERMQKIASVFNEDFLDMVVAGMPQKNGMSIAGNERQNYINEILALRKAVEILAKSDSKRLFSLLEKKDALSKIIDTNWNYEDMLALINEYRKEVASLYQKIGKLKQEIETLKQGVTKKKLSTMNGEG